MKGHRMPHLPHSGTNVTPLHPDTLTEIAATMDTLLNDIQLDNVDLEPAGTHTAIRLVRDRYRLLVAYQAGHPSTGGPRDGGAA